MASSGWGSWAGMGAPPPRVPRVNGKGKGKGNKRGRQGSKLPPPPPKKEEPSVARRDKDMPLVILNEKRVKVS